MTVTSTRQGRQPCRAVVAVSAALALVGCSHTEVWRLKKYVAPDSVERRQIEERVAVLYDMDCRVSGPPAKRYIVHGKTVALQVPSVGAAACRKILPYAICETEPTEDPKAICIRIE